MGRRSASSARCSVAGPTARSTATPRSGPQRLTDGSGTTTIEDDTQPSATNRPSLASPSEEPTCSVLTPRDRPQRSHCSHDRALSDGRGLSAPRSSGPKRLAWRYFTCNERLRLKATLRWEATRSHIKRHPKKRRGNSTPPDQAGGGGALRAAPAFVIPCTACAAIWFSRPSGCPGCSPTPRRVEEVALTG